MTTSDRAHDLAVEFRALNDYLHTAGDADAAMQRLVDLAQESVPGCAWAATSAWPTGRPPRTRSYTDEVARAVDQLQYDIGDGPCPAAADNHGSVLITDLATETRWPMFCQATLADTPVRSVLSYHLTGEPDRLALNMYGDHPGAFDTDAINTGALFATHAAVLALHANSADDAATLTHALSTSRQIGTAIGILMDAHKITEEQAFDMLRVTSQHLNRKLRDVARDVTDTGELPGKEDHR